MVQGLLFLAILIWLPVLFYGVSRQGFTLVLIFLLVAPVAVNVLAKPGTNPLFDTSVNEKAVNIKAGQKVGGYLGDSESTVKLTELLNPTRILYGALLIVFLSNAALKRRRLGPFDATEKFAFIFALILIASALLQARRVVYSLRIVCDAFVIPFIAYFCVRRLVMSEERLHRLIQVIAYAGFGTALICLVERLVGGGGYSRVSGPFNLPAAVAVIMSLIFIMALSESLRGWSLRGEKRLFPNGIRLSILCLAPLVVAFTWSRGLWLGFMGAFVVFVFLSWRFAPLSLRMVAVFLAFASAAVIALAFTTTSVDTIAKERITERTGTVYSRLGAWKVSLEEYVQAPVFGIGMSNLRDVLDDTRTRVSGVKSETHVHNSFIAILTEQGAVGLLAYLGVLASILHLGITLYQKGQHSGAALYGAVVIAIMVGYLTPALFAASLHLPIVHHVYVYSFVGAIASVYGRRISAMENTRSVQQRWQMGTDMAGRRETSAQR